MSELAKRLVASVVEAIPYDEDDGTVPIFLPDGGIDVWVPVESVARAAVVAVLQVLRDENFPEDAVDYQYACLSLADDVFGALEELEAK